MPRQHSEGISIFPVAQKTLDGCPSDPSTHDVWVQLKVFMPDTGSIGKNALLVISSISFSPKQYVTPKQLEID